jgi:hypothetical protein
MPTNVKGQTYDFTVAEPDFHSEVTSAEVPWVCAPSCGNGVVEWSLGEQCEIGVGNECGPYGECIDCRCVRVQ